MNQIEALNILINAVRFGQTKGIYSLEDAALLREAIKTFEKAFQAQEQAQQPIENVPVENAPATTPFVSSADTLVPREEA